MANILLIDDSTDVHEMVQAILGREHRVVAVTDWISANRHLFSDELDLILLDLDMPVTRGEEVARILTRTVTFRRLPLVLFSMLDEHELRRITNELGLVGYIRKTFDPPILRAEVESMLRRLSLPV